MIGVAKAHAEEDRVIGVAQLLQRDLAAKALGGLHGDVADIEDVLHLARGEIGRLIGGNAELVEAAQLLLRFVDCHLMAERCELVGAGKARRAAADNRDAPAGLRPGLVELLAGAHRHIGRVALQAADFDRAAFRRFLDTSTFAEVLGRADAGAHAAQNVAVENRLRRSDWIGR